jgi:hypothetical protein
MEKCPDELRVLDHPRCDPRAAGALERESVLQRGSGAAVCGAAVMYSPRLTVSRRRYEKGGRWGLAVGARSEAEPSSRAGTPGTQHRPAGSEAGARLVTYLWLTCHRFQVSPGGSPFIGLL